MRRKDTPETAAASGLSTDDLAGPRDTHPDDTYLEEGTEGTESMERASAADVPTFPGESTDTPSSSAEDAKRREASAPGLDAEEEAPQLLSPEDEEGFRTRWQEIQNEFVDDPRDAVHTADALVADVMQKLAATFADHKHELEGHWNRGEQVDTEELRLALRDYRSFFNRLLVS